MQVCSPSAVFNASTLLEEYANLTGTVVLTLPVNSTSTAVSWGESLASGLLAWCHIIMLQFNVLSQEGGASLAANKLQSWDPKFMLKCVTP